MMFSLPSNTRIYLSTQPTDMRKGFYSLGALVKAAQFDVYSGDFFLFLNRKRDKLKILTWSQGGFIVLYKSLEKGTFKPPPFEQFQTTLSLDPSQLSMLLGGIDLARVSKPKLWQPPSSTQSP